MKSISNDRDLKNSKKSPRKDQIQKPTQDVNEQNYGK